MPGLQTAYQLQSADLERAETARKLLEAEQGLGETEQLRQARAGLQRAETDLSQVRARVRDLEWETKALASKIATNEQRLYGGDVRNPKELESLQADLRYLRTRREALEDSTIVGLTQIDECEAALAAAQVRWEKTHAEWLTRQAEGEASVADLRARLESLDERIARLRAALPPSLLETYEETCRKKGGRGIAAIRKGMCEGCRVTVPTSIAQNVRRGDDLVRCSSCGRILCVAE